MKKYYILLSLCIAALLGCAEKGPYDESANAKADIERALAEAKSARIPLLIVFGANWCGDCQALNRTLTDGITSQKIQAEFKIIKVSVGDFDHNLDIAQHYGNPISGGIPGAALVNTQGKLLYATKPGELSTAINRGDDGVYNLLLSIKQKAKSA